MLRRNFNCFKNRLLRLFNLCRLLLLLLLLNYKIVSNSFLNLFFNILLQNLYNFVFNFFFQLFSIQYLSRFLLNIIFLSFDLLLQHGHIFTRLLNIVHHLLLLNSDRFLKSLEQFHVFLFSHTSLLLLLLDLLRLTLQVLVRFLDTVLHCEHFLCNQAETVLKLLLHEFNVFLHHLGDVDVIDIRFHFSYDFTHWSSWNCLLLLNFCRFFLWFFCGEFNWLFLYYV